MDQIELFSKSIKIIVSTLRDGGALGVLAIYVLYDKWWMPNHKKKKGTWVDMGEVSKRYEVAESVVNKMLTEYSHMATEIKDIKSELSGRLVKESEGNIKMAKLEVDHQNLKEMVIELKESRQQIFSMISDIKNMLIQQYSKK